MLSDEGGFGMSLEENRKNLIYFLEVAGPALDFEFIDSFVHPDVVLPAEHFPAGMRGVDGLKEGLRSYDTIFRGSVNVTDSIAEADKVAVRIVTKANHIGEFLGIPPSGHYFECDEIMIADFKDGKVVKFSRTADLYSLMRQLRGGPPNGDPPSSVTDQH